MRSTLLGLVVFGVYLFFVNEAHARLRVGQKFPEIRLNYLASESAFRMSTTRGKVELIDFWASDCGPCRVALPKINAIHLRFKSRGFSAVGINVDADPKDTARFLEEYKVEYPLVDDRKHSLIETLEVETMPTTYLLDRKGIVRFINNGFKGSDADVLTKKIQELLKEGPSQTD